MSLRSLVAQKKAQTRLDHPLANYTAGGKLYCLACSTPIKHEALFAAHLASKQHRRTAQARAQAQAQAQAKRAREEVVEDDDEEDKEVDDEVKEVTPEAPVAEEDRERKRPRLAAAGPGALPADFFADPSQAPSLVPASPSRSDTPDAAAAGEDDDWLEFARDVLGPTASTSQSAAPAPAVDTRATIFAEPVLYGDDEEAKEGAADDTADDGPPPETDAERRARLDLDEREELLSRIEECVRGLPYLLPF